MDPGEVERGRAVVRQGIADAAAEPVDQVVFRMARFGVSIPGRAVGHGQVGRVRAKAGLSAGRSCSYLGHRAAPLGPTRGSQPGARAGRRRSRGGKCWDQPSAEKLNVRGKIVVSAGIIGFQGLELRSGAIFLPSGCPLTGWLRKCMCQFHLRSDAISGVRFVLERVIKRASLVLVKPTSMSWMRSCGATRRSSMVSHWGDFGQRAAAATLLPAKVEVVGNHVLTANLSLRLAEIVGQGYTAPVPDQIADR